MEQFLTGHVLPAFSLHQHPACAATLPVRSHYWEQTLKKPKPQIAISPSEAWSSSCCSWVISNINTRKKMRMWLYEYWRTRPGLLAVAGIWTSWLITTMKLLFWGGAGRGFLNSQTFLINQVFSEEQIQDCDQGFIPKFCSLWMQSMVCPCVHTMVLSGWHTVELSKHFGSEMKPLFRRAGRDFQ